ncbi:MAG TPA: acyl-CoA dehydrogenase family protein [Stellaceae bacterium]|nr:acyl-CoA dehydrogenase family protein [Stellaceae bacterium]
MNDLPIAGTAAPVRPLARAKAIGTLISGEALAAERLTRLTDKVAAALLDANLFSILVPAADGGCGGSRTELFETAEEIARADGSAGWCVALCNGINASVHAGASARARREVFGDGPVACWGSLLPRAKSLEANGGFRVSGNFGWGSGSSLARWVVVPAPIEPRDGQQWFRGHLLPRADVEIKEGSWDAMGLRATASIDYTIVDKFVPAERTFEYPYLPTANPREISARGVIGLTQIGITAFASGVALRALAELVAAAPNIKRSAAEGSPADDNFVQFGIGEAEGRLKAARAYYLDCLAAQDRAIAEGHAPEASRTLDIMQAALTLTRAARDATVFAFDNAGTTAILAGNPLQRCLRDIFAGLKHASLTPAILGRIGKVRLGRDYGPLSF